mgnify:FL=1
MLNSLLEFLLSGTLLGIMAALSPGPLMTLLVGETMRHGVGGGFRVSVSPIITDIPFIVVALLLAKGVESSPVALGVLSIIGAAFLVFLAIQNIRTSRSDFSVEQGSISSSLWKGIVVNLLNPHMYLYWFFIATPTFARGDYVDNALFAGGLLFASVFTMMIVVVGVAKIRTHFFDYAHWILRGLGIALLLFAIRLGQSGITFFAQ